MDSPDIYFAEYWENIVLKYLYSFQHERLCWLKYLLSELSDIIPELNVEKCRVTGVWAPRDWGEGLHVTRAGELLVVRLIVTRLWGGHGPGHALCSPHCHHHHHRHHSQRHPHHHVWTGQLGRRLQLAGCFVAHFGKIQLSHTAFPISVKPVTFSLTGSHPFLGFHDFYFDCSLLFRGIELQSLCNEANVSGLDNSRPRLLWDWARSGSGRQRIISEPEPETTPAIISVLHKLLIQHFPHYMYSLLPNCHNWIKL